MTNEEIIKTYEQAAKRRDQIKHLLMLFLSPELNGNAFYWLDYTRANMN